MKKLTLVRHAKSSWNEPQSSDFDRPLNQRGKHDLPLMAERIVEFGLEPDLLLSSGAVRALTTAEQIAETTGYPEQRIIEVPELCGAGLETLINLLQGQSDHYRHIMVVGHNPTLESLGFYLTHEAIEKLPTCGIMYIPLSITSWDELSESCGTLERFDAPKMHYQHSPG